LGGAERKTQAPFGTRFVGGTVEGRSTKEIVMLTLSALGAVALLGQTLGGLVWLAIVFFIIALIAYVLGARGVAGMSAGIGRTLLFVFLVLAIIFLIVGLIGGGPVV
jgi:uncharacterized membrane protein YtjA (UPF0391 family)